MVELKVDIKLPRIQESNLKSVFCSLKGILYIYTYWGNWQMCYYPTFLRKTVLTSSTEPSRANEVLKESKKIILMDIWNISYI